MTEAPGASSTTTLVPIPDTGPKQIILGGRETKSTKKRASEDPPTVDSAFREKRGKSCSDPDLRALLSQQGETLQEVLKELRNLTATVDNVKTTVTNKMTTMKTKLAVQQDRIQSLQTARRDRFLNSLTLDTSQTTPLPSVPHFVAAPSTSTRVAPFPISLDPGAPILLDGFGL